MKKNEDYLESFKEKNIFFVKIKLISIVYT